MQNQSPTAGPRYRTVSSARQFAIRLVLGLLALIPARPGLGGGAEPIQGAQIYWAYRPLDRPARPLLKQASWVRNEVDAFVLAALESRGLKPAPEARREVLIRRLYFDLLGLPPAPADIDAFLADSDPQAYEKLVDRLLQDRRHGERWARFWLDLARYADTAGYEGDPDLPSAWRYRDYVIDAFNGDKPYDQFIREQIAGDEFEEVMGAGDLPEPKPEHLVALTFLRLAPFTEPRGDETRHEMLSEMTSTVGSVFLGLTVGCAKCHDHKYDAIPTKDFYRLKAFFATVQIPPPERGDAYQIGGSLPAEFYRPGEKEWAARERTRFERETEEARRELESLTRSLETRLGGGASGFGIQSSGGGLGNHYAFSRRAVADGARHLALVNARPTGWEIFNDGDGTAPLGSLAGTNRGDWFSRLAAIRHVALGQHTAGKGQPLGAAHAGRFAEVLIYDHPLNPGERRDLESYVAAKHRGPGDTSRSPPRTGLRFWLDAADLDANPSTPNPAKGTSVPAWIDKIGGLRLIQTDPKLQPVLDTFGDASAPAVRFEDDLLVGPAGEATFRRDSQGAIAVVFSATHAQEGYGFEVGGEGDFISTVIHPAAARGPKLKDALRDPANPALKQEDRSRHQSLVQRERFARQNLKRLQPVALSLRHAIGPPYEPGVPTSRVMIRGEYDNPGEVVEPGFLGCITGNQQPAKIRLDPFKRWPTRSRRMALAQWIASPDNPLTARVMMNRFWLWHFGRGLVPTPSDLGKLSGGPSHPELLDWLADEFVEQKWSLRAMHRVMVTSATYRQASIREDAEAIAADPEDVLLWRFRPRRLEAEAIRDSVLSVSGRLNPESFGLPIFPPLPGGLSELVKYDNSKWENQTGPEGRRRSIYIYQQRTLTMPLMQAFDGLVCDDSRPTRPSSVTPVQALAMFNGAFVHEEAGYFAERVRREAGSDPKLQVDFAVRLAFGRHPTPAESAHLQGLLQGTEGQEDRLAGVCRVLLNASEFVTVD